MPVKILVVALLALALAPGILQAKPHGPKNKAEAPLPVAPVEEHGGVEALVVDPATDPDLVLDPDLTAADAKPPTPLPPRPPSGTVPEPPPPPASPTPGQGRGNAFGRACRGFSRRKAPGQRQSPFKRCIEARKDAAGAKPKGAPAEGREAPEGAEGGSED